MNLAQVTSIARIAFAHVLALVVHVARAIGALSGSTAQAERLIAQQTRVAVRAVALERQRSLFYAHAIVHAIDATARVEHLFTALANSPIRTTAFVI